MVDSAKVAIWTVLVAILIAIFQSEYISLKSERVSGTYEIIKLDEVSRIFLLSGNEIDKDLKMKPGADQRAPALKKLYNQTNNVALSSGWLSNSYILSSNGSLPFGWIVLRIENNSKKSIKLVDIKYQVAPIAYRTTEGVKITKPDGGSEEYGRSIRIDYIDPGAKAVIEIFRYDSSFDFMPHEGRPLDGINLFQEGEKIEPSKFLGDQDDGKLVYLQSHPIVLILIISIAIILIISLVYSLILSILLRFGWASYLRVYGTRIDKYKEILEKVKLEASGLQEKTSSSEVKGS